MKIAKRASFLPLIFGATLVAAIVSAPESASGLEKPGNAVIPGALPPVKDSVSGEIGDAELALRSRRALMAALGARSADGSRSGGVIPTRSAQAFGKGSVTLSDELLPEMGQLMSSVSGTVDEPSGSVFLPTESGESCPGFYILRTHPGEASEAGRFGAELTLAGDGLRTLQGGLNFGGRAISQITGFSAFSIANAAGEDQVVDIGISVSRPGNLLLERRAGGDTVSTPVDQLIDAGESSISVVVPPGFYVIRYTPAASASTSYAISALTSFTDRPGGGFQGGAVVGGYHDPSMASGENRSTGFASFCIAEPFDVDVAVLSRPTYGSSGARDLDFSVSSGDGQLFLDTRRNGPGVVTRDCPECPDMIAIPAGSFSMGAKPDEPQQFGEQPQHTVSVPAFLMGRTEVTFAQWEICVDEGGCPHDPDDHGWGRGERPVINVTWEDAQQYVQWLSDHTGHQYRLPTEAEWEYAARGGTGGRYNTGDCISTLQANFQGGAPAPGCPGGEFRKQTVPVGRFLPNAWGLSDMHGNVWEWVEDCWAWGYWGEIPVDGSARMDGDCNQAVLRGGSWAMGGRSIRSATRARDNRDTGNHFRGFRVARYP